MNRGHLSYLVCPSCRGDLSLGEIRRATGDMIEDGDLMCSTCQEAYPIKDSIPRFVPTENYASGFGYEWLRHARTQYDSATGLRISEERFFKETRWDRDLTGQTILEVGGGSGRFTEQAASTGAFVVSLDYSIAVEANHASNRHRNNVLIVQADVFSMPVRKSFFDKCYCFGVLQHTPDPERAFMALPEILKPGGSLAADIYKLVPVWKRWFYTKYAVRPWTSTMEPERLYRLCERYIDLMWPISRLIHHLPFGVQLNWFLLIADYRNTYALTEQQLKEWALLDTFDMLSPRYDIPVTLETFHSWFVKAGLENIDVHFGFNGIEGRGRKPMKIQGINRPS